MKKVLLAREEKKLRKQKWRGKVIKEKKRVIRTQK